MKHPFMEDLATLLVKKNIAVLRYQFRYMEMGSRRPDPPAIAHKAVEAALVKANELYPKLGIFAGGKSFGGRMSSQFLAKDKPAYIKGIVFFGFPLHPPGKPSCDRADHLKEVNVPKLFLQGTRDALAEKDMMSDVSKKLKKSTLKFFEGADHSFRSGKKTFISELAEESALWLASFA